MRADGFGMPRIVPGLVMVLSATLIWSFGCSGPPAPQEIRAILPLSGPSADLGRSVANGMSLAADEMTKSGSPKTFTLVLEDSKGRPAEATTVYQALAARGKQPLVLSWMSSIGRALAPLTLRDGSALFVGAALQDLVRSDGLVVRVWPSAHQLAELMGNFALRSGRERVAILWVNDDYGRSVSQTFARTVTGHGIEVVASEPLETGASDFRVLLERIRERNPDSVYMPAYGSIYVHGLKQVREILGSSVEIWADLPLISSYTSPNLGNEVEGVVVPATELDFSHSEYPRAQQFATSYRAQFGLPPDFNSGLGYMMFTTAVGALRNGASTGAEVARFVSSTAVFDGPLGEIRYLANNDCVIPLKIARIRAKGLVAAEAESPAGSK